MGVKSTVTLSRRNAEDRYAELLLGERTALIKRQIRSEIALLEDKELETKLMHLHDKVNGGEGYENYMIEGD